VHELYPSMAFENHTIYYFDQSILLEFFVNRGVYLNHMQLDDGCAF